tara:strand:+ start:42527 stop:48934 length:6408 start_codon:yes stop_codon:yes gene_type:complete
MAKRRRGNDGDSYNRRILRKIEHKTHISETIEEFDPDTGRIVRREVRTKDIDAKITEDDHPYSVPQRLESGQPPVQSDRSPVRIPEQWKVSVFDSYTDAPLSVADFAGDYVVSRVSATDDDQIIVWESAFVECQGLSCLRVTANAEHQQLKLTAEFVGRIQGPRWTKVVSDDLHGPIQLQRDHSVPHSDYADADWPLTVTLVAMGQSSKGGPSSYDSSPRYISPEPTAAMRAMMAGGGSSGSSSAPPLPPYVPPCPPDTCCPTSPPGMNPPGSNPPGMNPPGQGSGDFDFPTAYSMSPVRYFDGQLSLSATDIATKGFGFPWGQTRSYSNKLDALDEGLGYNWIGGADPYLVEDVVNSRIAVVHNADSTTWFEDNSGSFTPLLGSLSSLTYDSGNSQYKYTDDNGKVTIFNDFNDLNRPGMFIEFQSEGGNSITVTDTSGEMVTEMQRSQTVNGVTTTDSFVYSYGSSGASLNRLESVVWRQKIDAGSWTNILRVTYSYYGDSESFGSLGDLKTAVRGEWNGTSWSTLGTSYYRYYKSGDPNGFEHGLRYALNEQAFQNLSDDPNVSDPFTASNALVSLYADYYFEYDSQQRVTKESVKGGAQTFTFGYTESSNTDDVNNWKNKTVETLPDGTIKTVYTNYVGQPLLQDFQSDSDHWLSYIEYNSDSRIILRATPAAITSYNDSTANLGVVLKSSEGLIYLNEYYSSTGSGGAQGYLKSRKLKEGSSGTAVVLNLTEYTSHSAGGSTIYPVSRETTYTNDDGTGAVSTEYNRTYHSGTVQIDQKTTTLPAIPTFQNGSGTANSFVEVFDIDGYLTWQKDERGFITRFKYNTATGAIIQRIDDVDTAQVTDEPSGWVTPTGGGLHLITDYESDDQGRVTQELGPAHTIDLGGTATEIRTATWKVYKDPEFRTVIGKGYQKTSDSSFTLVNPVSITKRDKNGNILEQIQATRASSSGKLLPTDTFAQSSYVSWTTNQYTECCLLESTRDYHTIPSSGSGSSGTNYDQTDFGYDSMKRQNRMTTPGGTITFNVHDVRGNVTKIFVGTDDTGATNQDPTGGGALGNNMVQVTGLEYDSGNSGGNNNRTKQTQYATASDTRVTLLTYDWRNRNIDTDGEIDYFQRLYYDNLDRITKTERYDTTSAGNLIARSETKYDDLDRVYQTIQYGVDPSTGTVGNSLTDNTWYDAASNVIKELPAGSDLFTKQVYDSLERLTTVYQAYDLDETSYADAGSVTDDTVIEQNEMTYDDAGNMIQNVTRQRYHDAPASQTGALQDPSTTPKARVTYTATYSDTLGRIVANANYGTNGGAALTRSTTIPSRSDTVLVTSFTIDSAGRLYQTTDPAGKVNQTEYNANGREIKRTLNVQASTSSSSSSGCPDSLDANIIVSTTYNADGNISSLVANNSLTGIQTTTYTYGTTLSDSEIATSLLKRSEIYPDSIDSSDVISFKYSRQIQIIETQDQGNTVHVYDFDKLGRQIQDRITTLGTGVDSAVRRIATTYELRGMQQTVTSYDNASVGLGTVVNEVQFVYNDFGQLITDYQAHSGTVNVSTTPKVQYGFSNGSNNIVRPTTLTYPDGRVLAYDYGATNDIDDALSRVATLVDDDMSSTHLTDYTYLGLRNFVEVDYTEPDIKYTLIGTVGGNDPDTGDIYHGFDRFSRIVDSYWYDYGSSTDVDRIKYGYDRMSNRTYRENVVADAQSKYFDELYNYDGIDRLKNLDRGNLNSLKDSINNLQFAECWSLDETGNWKNFREDTTGNGTWNLNQDRTANKVNEITDITETAGPSWITPAYSESGNMTTLPQLVDPTKSYTATYDAWNRLVKIVDSSSSNTVTTYEYDGAKRQTIKKIFSGGTLSETRHIYFSEPSKWQVIEERVDSDTSPLQQFVWGLRYQDDLILRDKDTNGNGTLDERLYALQDANWNMVSIVNTSGTVQERYNYDAYGTPGFWDASFSSRTSSSFDWHTLFAGYCWDSDVKLFQVRNRVFGSHLGTWLQRDPLHYIDSTNLYQYVNSNPLNLIDPLGTTVCLAKDICDIEHDACMGVCAAIFGGLMATATYFLVECVLKNAKICKWICAFSPPPSPFCANCLLIALAVCFFEFAALTLTATLIYKKCSEECEKKRKKCKEKAKPRELACNPCTPILVY